MNQLSNQRSTLGCQTSRKTRRGLTLIELLVVILIIGILAASAVPMLQTGMENARAREGARLVSSVLSLARSRAISLGHPVGVVLDPLGTTGTMSDTIYFVEVPAPYSGDTFSSTITFTPDLILNDGTVTVGFPSGDSTAAIIQVGDQLQINHQGHLYQIDEIVSATPPISWKVSSATASSLRPVASPGLPFKIIRSPKKSSASPTTLPAQIVVDIANSGIGAGSFSAGQVMILFSSTGSLQRVYHAGAPLGERVDSFVHLHIGRPGPALGAENLADMRNFWVSVSGTTGRVITAENGPYDASLNVPDGTYPEIDQRRALATSGITSGGR